MDASKIQRFFAEAGALGVGSVIFALVLWIIAAVEHYKDKNIPALWFLIGGCVSFCIGAFMAWSKADDRANERKPQLGLWANEHSFFLTHLQGDPARFIEIDPIQKQPSVPSSTRLHFDPIDFLSSSMGSNQRALTPRLEILSGDRLLGDMDKILGIVFSSWTQPSASFPVKIRFRWNGETIEQKVMLRYIAAEKRFETHER